MSVVSSRRGLHPGGQKLRPVSHLPSQVLSRAFSRLSDWLSLSDGSAHGETSEFPSQESLVHLLG